MSRVERRDERLRREEEAREAARELELAPDLDVALSLDTVNALARNALAAAGDSPLAPKVPIKLVAAGHSLAHDGCDYLEGVHLFLAVRGCPEDAVSFVLALAGMSGGDSEGYFKATDEQIAARLNCSTKTVQRKRKALVEWSGASGYAVVQIREGRFDRALLRNAPTEYRVPVVRGAEKLVRWARSNGFYARSRHGAMNEAAQKELIAHVEENSADLPTETVTQARAVKKAEPKEYTPAEMRFTEKKQKLMRMVDELIDDGAELKVDVREVWERIADRAERRLEAKGL